MKDSSFTSTRIMKTRMAEAVCEDAVLVLFTRNSPQNGRKRKLDRQLIPFTASRRKLQQNNGQITFLSLQLHMRAILKVSEQVTFKDSVLQSRTGGSCSAMNHGAHALKSVQSNMDTVGTTEREKSYLQIRVDIG